MKRSYSTYWRRTIRPSGLFVAALSAALLVSTSCASNPPRSPDNVCAVFEEKPKWWRAAKRAERKWQLPPEVAMAFVHRESAYVSNAKPPRKKKLGFIPWGRVSSAYGYAQATDEAWADYIAATDRWFSDRDDFSDALDFIGWYNTQSRKRLRLKSDNARHLYLAYHEGWGGYRSGRWRRDKTVQRYADIVAGRAANYHLQLKQCRGDLDSGWWIFS